MIYQANEQSERSSHIASRSDPTQSHPLRGSSHAEEVLCRIAFELDDKQEELLVYRSTMLKDLTEELIEKLKKSGLLGEEDVRTMTEGEKAILKEQIKAKIEQTMELNTQKSLQAAQWRNKLKEIIEQKVRTPMDSLLSPSTQRQTPSKATKKSVSYFRYNNPPSEKEQTCRQREIIERMKILDHSMNKQSKGRQTKPQRLYDLGKQTDLLREYLSKIHEYETLEQELSECTFHPNIKKINHELKSQTSNSDVFSRLYHEAIDKKQKMKKIETQVLNRQHEEYKHLNFIPQINSCSKEIIMAKKEQKSNIYENLYKEASLKEQKKKKFQPEYTFHPTLCQKSEEIVKKVQANRSRNGLFKDEVSISTKKLAQSNIAKQQSAASLHRIAFRTENSQSRSPIAKKQKSTKRLDKYKLNRDSDVSLNQIKKKQETLKKVAYQRDNAYESQSTLKQNFFNRKPFKKMQKSSNQDTSSCYVDSKHIKREKIIILDPTQETCNTEQTCQKYDFQMSEPSQSSTQKSKKNKMDPHSFFQQRQKTQGVSNKQNIKQYKQQQKSMQMQFHKRKNKIFQDIFTYFLSQSHNQTEVTYEAIAQNSSIPESLKHIFQPMAEEMRQLSVGLDKEEFVWSMIRIFDSLSLQQRGWILAWGLKLEQPGQTTKKFR